MQQITPYILKTLHISTGVMVLGEDIEQPQYDILKTMLRGNDQHLRLPGSSLKGVVRSVHEAITNSTLGVITPFARRERWIPQHRSLNPKKVHQLCLSSRLFGAMNWQGVLHFQDARCQTKEFRVQCLPSLYAPQEKKFIVLEKTDINELKKAISYLRTISNRQDLGRHFLVYCQTLEEHGDTISHSKKTKQYYKSLLSIFDYYLRQCLKKDFKNFEVVCEILCWASGFAKYYKTLLPKNAREEAAVKNHLRQQLKDYQR
ncbi:MAG: hypothetical protein EA395_00415 [Phormidium sp. GEM2.Bin31]|nr:MAG: hypothetical protein EA395_00415 [Phormidium sp. GEM2.Bin31]